MPSFCWVGLVLEGACGFLFSGSFLTWVTQHWEGGCGLVIPSYNVE